MHAKAQSLSGPPRSTEQLGGIAASVDAGMQKAVAQSGIAPEDSERARVARVVQSAYAPDRLRAISTGVLAARMDAQHLDALRRWFDSPEGQAITRAEEASLAGKEDAGASMKHGIAQLEAMPPERRKLLEDLLAATHAADAMVQLTIGTAIAVQLGVASTQPDRQGPSPDQMRAALERRRPQLLQTFSAMMLASFAGAYAAVPSEQLQQYVAFVRTPAGSAFNDAVIAALGASMTDAATELGRRLPGTRDGSNT